jgi:alcohol dehydrogenase class IV
MTAFYNIPYPFLKQITIYLSPRKIIFGVGSRTGLPKELKELAGSRPLIVTHRETALSADLEELIKMLSSAGVDPHVHYVSEPEPSLNAAEELAAHTRSGNYDLVIGLGGGSVMDLAKIASLSVTNLGEIKNYLGLERVPKKGVPLICMPTTSGTGSEVTIFSVLTLDSKKRGVTTQHNLPDVALIDPALTVTMPPSLTASTGMDALSQAIEPITSLAATPMTDALALTAIELVGKWLKVAYSNGSDIEARTGMSMAATLSGLAFGNGKLTLGHSLAQTFGPMKKISHGVSCGIALPYIMEFYLPVIPERLSLIAAAMGVDVSRIPVEEAAAEAIRTVKRLSDDVGIPVSLRQMGFDKAEIPTIAETCVKEQPRPNSPREMTKESVLEVLERMWEGKILS